MVIAAILSLLSLLGLIFSITSGLLFAGIDGLFIVLVCLLMGTLFGLLALRMAVQAGYLCLPGRSRKDSP